MPTSIQTKIALLVSVIFSFTPILSFSQTTNLSCHGVTKGKTIDDEWQHFDIEVNLNPPDINGPVGPMGSCFLTISKERLKGIKYNCSLGNNDITCSCAGGDYIESSIHVLSRLSGRLQFTSIRKNDIQKGDYACKLVEKRLF